MRGVYLEFNDDMREINYSLTMSTLPLDAKFNDSIKKLPDNFWQFQDTEQLIRCKKITIPAKALKEEGFMADFDHRSEIFKCAES